MATTRKPGTLKPQPWPTDDIISTEPKNQLFGSGTGMVSNYAGKIIYGGLPSESGIDALTFELRNLKEELGNWGLIDEPIKDAQEFAEDAYFDISFTEDNSFPHSVKPHPEPKQNWFDHVLPWMVKHNFPADIIMALDSEINGTNINWKRKRAFTIQGPLLPGTVRGFGVALKPRKNATRRQPSIVVEEDTFLVLCKRWLKEKYRKTELSIWAHGGRNADDTIRFSQEVWRYSAPEQWAGDDADKATMTIRLYATPAASGLRKIINRHEFEAADFQWAVNFFTGDGDRIDYDFKKILPESVWGFIEEMRDLNAIANGGVGKISPFSIITQSTGTNWGDETFALSDLEMQRFFFNEIKEFCIAEIVGRTAVGSPKGLKTTRRIGQEKIGDYAIADYIYLARE